MHGVSYKSQVEEVLGKKLSQFLDQKSFPPYDKLLSELTDEISNLFVNLCETSKENNVKKFIEDIKEDNDVYLDKNQFFEKYSNELKVLRGALVSIKISLKNSSSNFIGSINELIKEIDIIFETMEGQFNSKDNFDNMKWLLAVQDVAIEAFQLTEKIKEYNKDNYHAKFHSRIINPK
jgi:hypothetical protein